MVSMIGGGDSSRVPRKSIGTTLLLDTSPCMRAEKRVKEFARAQAIEANRAASLSALTGEPINRVQAGSSRESVFEYSPSRGRSCIPSRPFARPRPPANGKSTAEDSDSEDVPSGKTPSKLDDCRLIPIILLVYQCARPLGLWKCPILDICPSKILHLLASELLA